MSNETTPSTPRPSNAFSFVVQKVHDLQVDAEAFYGKGNKTAGTRLRKGLQELKVLAQTARQEVTDKKNG